MKWSSSVALLLALVAGNSATAGWLDGLIPSYRTSWNRPHAASSYVIQPYASQSYASQPRVSYSYVAQPHAGQPYAGRPAATIVSWGGPRGEVVVESGCGCAYPYEVDCGCHWRPFSCFSWPALPLPSLGCGLGCHRWFGWLHRHTCEPRCGYQPTCGCSFTPSCGCHFEPSCGCSYQPACGYTVPATQWKAPTTPAPAPVNPPRPKPEKVPDAQSDRKA